MPVITSGGTGVGKGISLALANEGPAAVVAARSLSGLKGVVNDIKSRGGKAKAIQSFVPERYLNI